MLQIKQIIKRWRIKVQKGIPLNILLVNFIFQRILRIDNKCKYSKNYTSRVLCAEKLFIENDSIPTIKSLAVSGGCYIQACGGIQIGENTIFATGVSLISIEHDIYELNKIGKKGKIVIGKNCWLGAKVTILPRVILGDNTIVGANSVVTKSFPEGNVILAGTPAKIIKKISREQK